MGPYLGDFKDDSIVCFNWDSNNKAGASITRAANGTIKIFKDNDTTECTAGITDTEDFAGLTGVHNCRIDLAADEFFQPSHDYSVVLAGAVIDTETVNASLASFSIENRFSGNALVEKAAKVILNKAVQNKLTGEINYYDDDGETILLTHTPQETENSLTRMPS